MRAASTAIGLSLGILIVTSACDRSRDEPRPEATAPATGEAVGPGGRGLAAPEPTPGVRFRLSDAEPGASAAGEALRSVAGEPLDAAALAPLLARLPALPVSAAVTQTFALRPGPRPPAIAGETVLEPFPPQATAGPPPAAEAGALEVSRYQPEGAIHSAPRLSVSFDQPMVPLGSHAELAAREVPVRIEPEPAGQWRWVGSQTLVFEPEGGRFPMATEYRVTVPAGTEAESGAALAEAVAWSFDTPPPKVTAFHPTDKGVERQPVIFVAFDQAVEPEALLPHMRATVEGRELALRLATPVEVLADEAAWRMARQTVEGRWIGLRPVDPLPLDSEVELTLGPELPSAEGPRVTTELERFTFRVYGPLRVEAIRCAYQEPVPFGGLVDGARAMDCPPLAPWSVDFNNDLDPETFDPEAIVIEPELPERRIELHGDTLVVTGLSKGRTRYSLRLPAGLRDLHGQTLGEDVTLVFETGDAQPALLMPGQDALVLDPEAGGRFAVYSINVPELALRLLEVAPEDWAAFQNARNRQGDENPPPPPGRERWSGTLKPGGERDALVATSIDLAPALNADGLGQVLLVVEPSPSGLSAVLGENVPRPYTLQPQWRWIQSTRLGLSAFDDGTGTLAWVSELADASPVSGAQVSAEPGGPEATSDGAGLAALEAWARSPEADPHTLLVASRGGDTLILPKSWWPRGDLEGLAWYVFTDRGLYKPGESVRLKGWVRRNDGGKGGDLEALGPGVTEIAYTFTAPNGEAIAEGRFPVGDLGGFDGVLEIPAEVELGQASLALNAVGGTDIPSGRDYGLGITIAEFRRPEFEVSAQAEAPYVFIGEQAVVAVEAAYFAGGALPEAEVDWQVYAQPTSFTPPGRDDFQFGIWRPWWGWDGLPPAPERVESHSGRTDALGRHRLAVDVDGVYPLAPASFRAEATVEDVNRQAWTGSASFLAHPAAEYVGLRADRWFVEPGQAFAIESIVADLDGALVPGRAIRMRAEKVDATWEGDRYEETLSPAGDCSVDSAEEPVTCDFRFETGGTYRLTAEIQDAEGRPNMSQLTLWVSGGDLPPQRGVELERATLVPSATELQPGDTLELLVQAPFSPAEGLLTIRRSGLLRQESFRIEDSSTTLRVPVDAALMPNFSVQVDLAGSAPRLGADGAPDPALPARPAYASGSLEIAVPPLERTLELQVLPAEEAVEPGGSTEIEVTVRDAAGQPLAEAELALVVVDEAILALGGYRIPDPIEILYPPRPPGVDDSHSRAYVQLAAPEGQPEQGAQAMLMALGMGGGFGGEFWAHDTLSAGAASAEMMAFESEDAAMPAARPELRQALAATPAPTLVPPPGEEAPQVDERIDLDALAAFVPAARTDAQGRVVIPVDLPDSVTRYRITAVATDGERRFGRGESSLTARLPLVVRPSAPRFLNFGDAFELPVVVQNQGEAEAEVDVVLRAANLGLEGGLADEAGATLALGRRVTVPAGDRVEVRFPAAARMPGTAAFQAAVFGEAGTDAQRVTLPVWTPATTEAFATYGEIDDAPVAQPLRRPADAVPEFGGLELTTSATALSSLTDAFLYLYQYPFEGAEQTASRLISTVALADLLFAFGAEGMPSEAEVAASIAADVARLEGMQNSDGGWDWWRRDAQSSPFVTLHVAHALARAAEKGHPVRPETLAGAQGYLTEIESHLAPLELSEDAARSLRTYALYVRMLLGDRRPEEARAIFAEDHEPPIDDLGWLLSVMAGDPASAAEIEEIRRRLANAAVEEAGTAQFTTGFAEADGRALLASDRRTDAIVLEALIADQPESDLIPKLVRGLLAHRTRGRWNSTQENAWVLLALDRYFRTYEGVTPDFVARAWLGEGFLGETAFRGRTADRGQVTVPMVALPEGQTETVTLAKEGPGRLYYRLGLRYAPEDLELEPLERGFAVERRYEAVDDPDDVRQMQDGSWRIKPGARVRVRLSLAAPARRYHVALVDPLPAGLEALNPELALTGTLPPDPEEDASSSSSPWPWWRAWRWFDHEAYRDERVEVFAQLLPEGVYDYSYIARATTPGRFVVPPPKAEELYQPETFGRGGSEVVEVR